MLLGSSPIPRRGSWVPCALTGLKTGCLVAVNSCGEVIKCLCPSCESKGPNYRDRMIDGGGFQPESSPCPWTPLPVAPPQGRKPCGPSYDWRATMANGAYTATFVPQGPGRPARPSRPPGMSTTFTARPGRVGLLGTFGPNDRMLHGGGLVAGELDLAASACAPDGKLIVESTAGGTVARCEWPKASMSGGLRLRAGRRRPRRRGRRGRVKGIRFS